MVECFPRLMWFAKPDYSSASEPVLRIFVSHEIEYVSETALTFAFADVSVEILHVVLPARSILFESCSYSFLLQALPRVND